MKTNDLPPVGGAPGAPSAGEELAATARTYGMEFLESVPDEVLDPDLVADLGVDWARTNRLLPVRIGGETCVLTCYPDRVAEQESLSLLVGREMRPILVPEPVILRAIERCYFSRDDSPCEFLRDLAVAETADGGAVAASQTQADDLLTVAREAPVTQLVNLILLEAVKRRASDIHFEPFEDRLRVRYRIDGVLYEQTAPPKQYEGPLVSRLKVMAHMDIAEKRLPQDGMARVRVGEREIDIRASTVPVAEGERVVLRLLDKDKTLLPLGDLGMDRVTLDAFLRLLGEVNGMIAVCGPTGSGKTTTLYAALGNLDASRKNIMTVEEPIEYQLADIGQIQVKPKIGLTFAHGLRHILRQDPDVVLVGETRDLETASIAVRASLTGHLVLTTLHTNDAASALVRLVDMGVEPYLLASCLRGVLAQRLVRCLCPQCRRAAPPDPAAVEELGGMQELAGVRTWEPVGCPSCLEGYGGRVGIFELLAMSPGMQSLVRSGAVGADGLRDDARRRGVKSLRDDAIAKVREGVTSLAEAVAAVR